MNIPFHIPYHTEKEAAFVHEAIKNGCISGDGYYTQMVQHFLEKEFGAKKVLMTTSATHALEMAAILIDLKPGDEVLMPSYTFPSTANAVMLRGATPVFVDIKDTTLTMDLDDMLGKLTSRTKAIIPVHYAGIGCEMDEIMNIARDWGLYVIEDAAQAVNAKYKNQYLGTWGHIGCYSFHGTKNYTSGEGGAILLNSQDEEFLNRGEVLWQKGTNRKAFMRGDVEQYQWVDIGSSYTPSDLLMAFLAAQLENLEDIRNCRQWIHQYYTEQLKSLVEEEYIRTITIPEPCQSNYHLYYIRFKNEATRNRVKEKLASKGIAAATHFVPLHSSPMGQRYGYHRYDLPVTEKVSKTLLRLPMYTSMTEEALVYVVKQLVSSIKEGETI
ncbi:MAG: dTDP-4-amino-4,6-dideoxygalactose transaminase [Bacillota bacterium]